MFKRFFSRGEKKIDQEKADVSETPTEEVPPVVRGAFQTYATEKDQEKAIKSADIEAEAAKSDGAPFDKDALRNRIVETIKTIYDPEIPVNIYDIGLIYEINPQDSGIVQVVMTLTTPNCPAAGILPGEVESKTRGVEGVKDCELELTFEPPWNPDLMSEAAKLELGML